MRITLEKILYVTFSLYVCQALQAIWAPNPRHSKSSAPKWVPKVLFESSSLMLKMTAET